MSYHWSHPEHALEMVNIQGRYVCDGCLMDGMGARYRCGRCDFDLHKDCIYAPSELKFRGQKCEFLSEPLCVCKNKGKSLNCNGCRSCDACGKTVYGFVYHSTKTGCDYHPPCANLKPEIAVGDVKFKLVEKKQGSSKCLWCNNKSLEGCAKNIPGMLYVSNSKQYECDFHVHCMMDMAMQGNLSNTAADTSTALVGLELPLKPKSKKRGSATKWLEILKIFLTTVLSILLGDPTTIIATTLAHLVTQGLFNAG